MIVVVLKHEGRRGNASDARELTSSVVSHQ